MTAEAFVKAVKEDKENKYFNETALHILNELIEDTESDIG